MKVNVLLKTTKDVAALTSAAQNMPVAVQAVSGRYVVDAKLDESYICIITLSGIPCTIESDSLRVLRGGKWILLCNKTKFCKRNQEWSNHL